MRNKCILILSFLCIISNLLIGQEEKKSPFEVNADLVSRYVWRGSDFGGSPAIQPGFTFVKKGLKIGAWGSYTFNGNQTQEADLFISYTALKNLVTVSFTDYFFPVDGMLNRYLDYTDSTTTHVFEGAVSFNGTEKLPLSLLIAANVYGNDAKKVNGDIMYSTYIELAYAFKNAKVFAGFNPIAPDLKKGETGFYGNYMGFVNIGVTAGKDIKVSDTFSIPFKASLITNPQKENIFLVLIASF